jgi:hypothetical protein
VCASVATTGSGHHSQATSKPFFFLSSQANFFEQN